MRISTLPLYLVGKRSAIEEVAVSPMTVAIGILFTISAGFAREYDGEDLLHEPWHVILPLVASLAMGSVLFVLVHSAVSMRRQETESKPPRLGQAYRSFMGLFWMTAPLAWLYAVPYEQFLSPLDAMRCNLWTLAVVAAWRVLLISRAISVVYGMRFVQAFFMVMLFADVLTFLVVLAMPKPIIAIMGGIRYSEIDRLVLNVTHNVMALSVLTVLIWAIGAFICGKLIRKAWPEQPTRDATQRTGGLLIFALVSILAWAPALWISQPDQWRKRKANQLLRNGDVAEAFRLMSIYGQDKYPLSWNPPPRNSYGERVPDIDEVIQAMRDEWPAEWVTEIYMGKIRRAAKQAVLHYHWGDEWSDLADRLEDGRITMARAGDAGKLAFLLEFDHALTDADRDVLTRLIELAEAEAELE